MTGEHRDYGRPLTQNPSGTLPPLAKWLGFAGLAPQLAALIAASASNPEWRIYGSALGQVYAALILSFVGGMWWGVAAQFRHPVPPWIWLAAIAPSLVSLLSALLWIGDWHAASLYMLGLSLLASLWIDTQLGRAGLCPRWWMRLRAPLSIGLGLLSVAIGYLA